MTASRRWAWRAFAALLLVGVAAGTVRAFEPAVRTRLRVDLGSAAVQGPPDSCLPGRRVPVLASPHIPSVAATHARYDSLPPTSGPHVPFTVAPGLYDEPIADELQTHAIEHGHVLLQYAPDAPARDVDVLKQIARARPREVLVAPYPKLRRGLALTAWGRIERLRHADVGRINAFVEAFSGRYNHGWRRHARCAP
jgi:hypothetical protein